MYSSETPRCYLNNDLLGSLDMTPIDTQNTDKIIELDMNVKVIHEGELIDAKVVSYTGNVITVMASNSYLMLCEVFATSTVNDKEAILLRSLTNSRKPTKSYSN